MKIRQVTLNEGSHDGAKSIASHETAFMGGELYVQDGTKPGNDQFVHAKTALGKLPDAQHKEEYERVKAWMEHADQEVDIGGGKKMRLPQPMSTLLGIPPWRINAWYQLIKIGEVYAA